MLLPRYNMDRGKLCLRIGVDGGGRCFVSKLLSATLLHAFLNATGLMTDLLLVCMDAAEHSAEHSASVKGTFVARPLGCQMLLDHNHMACPAADDLTCILHATHH